MNSLFPAFRWWGATEIVRGERKKKHEGKKKRGETEAFSPAAHHPNAWNRLTSESYYGSFRNHLNL